jgi:NADH:ubiquinone oxidoreductase subunit F (NADH-binding)
MRLLQPETLSFADHLATHGPLPHDAGAALEEAGLRGRGGAGFPVARKLSAARKAHGRPRVVVNATESEPASLKDQVLTTRSPHLVLDGALLAARAVRAKEVGGATHEGSVAGPALRRAIDERPDGGQVRLLEVPARYVSGEASALASAAAGGPARPYLHDRPLAVGGPRGRPTVVLNAESVAGLALLLRHGKAWYAREGTLDEPGTLLLTIRRSGLPPSVLEVPVGTPLTVALRLAGVGTADLQAVLVGGWFGRWLPLPEALDVPLSHAGMRAAGGMLGAGLVMALGNEECGLRATTEVVRTLAGESAGQCGPCVNGLPALARAMEDVVGGFGPGDAVTRVDRYRSLVARRGLCGLPDGTADLAGSALEVFAADLANHGRGGCGRPPGMALGVRATETAAVAVPVS